MSRGPGCFRASVSLSTITARREKEGEGERMVDALSKIFDFTIINIRSVSSESEYGKKLDTFVLA